MRNKNLLRTGTHQKSILSLLTPSSGFKTAVIFQNRIVYIERCHAQETGEKHLLIVEKRSQVGHKFVLKSISARTLSRFSRCPLAALLVQPGRQVRGRCIQSQTSGFCWISPGVASERKLWQIWTPKIKLSRHATFRQAKGRHVCTPENTGKVFWRCLNIN